MTNRTRLSSGLRHRARRGQRGTALTEFAILAPALIVLVFWANYFWEVQHVRLKGAELARFMAFERTVRQDTSGIATSAMERYQDLDGSTKTGGPRQGFGFQNPFHIAVQVEDVEATLAEESLSGRGSAGGAMGFLDKALTILGDSAELVAKMMGLDPAKGGVRAQVDIRIENGLIPRQLAFLRTGFGEGQLDLHFTEQFMMVHDTWRAWGPGDDPADSYARVEQLTYERVQRAAYAGIVNEKGVLDAIGKVLTVIGLDFPFMTDYVRDSVVIRSVPSPGRYSAVRSDDTRTVPGSALQAAYWTSDTEYCLGTDCEDEAIRQKRGTKSKADYGDNWPMRAYNCRGRFFQGAIRSDAPEAEYAYSSSAGAGYHNYGDTACK